MLTHPPRRSLYHPICEKPVLPQTTGDLAYRIILTADQVTGDTELWDFVTRPGIRIWLGPGAHVVAYSLLGGEMFNVVLLVSDDLPHNVAKVKGDLEGMVKLFEGWDPLLKKLLSRVKKVHKWRLMYLHFDEPWSSKQGTLVMAGDSCHSILPYMAQISLRYCCGGIEPLVPLQYRVSSTRPVRTSTK